MTLFNRLFKDLFGKDVHQLDEKEGIHIYEEIKRSQVFLDNFHNWQCKGIHNGILDYIFKNWQSKVKNTSSDVNMQLFNSNLSNGFYFRAESPWDTFDYDCLIQYIIEKCKLKGYVLKNAKREVIEEGGLLKTIEEFYLKPSLKYRRELPFEQFWGNILIEHRIVNECTRLVKVMINSYNDRSYKKAYDFEDFMNYIFIP